MQKKIFLALILMPLFFAACSEDNTSPTGGNDTGNLTLDIQRLEDLGTAANYEGWVLVNGTPVSTGTFTVNSGGELSRTVFQVNFSNLSGATAFVLTIEPNPDPNPDPSSQKLMAGDFSGNTSNLSINHPVSLGTDFSTASGNYILATPTDGENNNELSGAWFVMLNGGPQAGLVIPVLPAGWVYEGWIVIPGQSPLSTGRFTGASGSDLSAPYSGIMPAPPFPGEDLLVNAPMGYTFPVNLQNAVLVVSVEPEPDNSAAQFLIKPLVANVSSNAVDHTNYLMNNQSSSNNPTGTATR